jgi:hypothetical protein
MSMEPPTVAAGGNVEFSAYDAEVAPFLEGTALPSGARFTTINLRENSKLKSDEERIAYYRKVAQHHRDRKWQALLFYYAKDEPKPAEYPILLAQASRVHRAGNIPVLVTSPFTEKLNEAADIWCLTLNCLFPRSGPPTCPNITPLPWLREHIGPQKLIWWYQSCMSHGCDPKNRPRAPDVEAAFTDWASYMVDHPIPLNRAMGVLAYSFKIQGELYWDTAFAYQDRDPWLDVYAFAGNGDGTLFYPGTPDRIGGTTHIPIESLRLKAIRDGLEDYEFLSALAQHGAASVAIAEEASHRLARSAFDITLDPQVWEETRRQIALQLNCLASTKAQVQ